MVPFIRLEAEVRKLVAENPENIYLKESAGCYYNRGNCTNGSVGCIFGQAFGRLGVTIPEHEDDSIAIWLVLPVQVCDYGDKELAWAQKLQEQQDEQRTWAAALEDADMVVDNIRRHPPIGQGA